MVTRVDLIAALRGSTTPCRTMPVQDDEDAQFQISSHLVRCTSYNRMPSMFVPSDDKDVIRNAVVDAVHWLKHRLPSKNEMQLFIPADTDPETSDAVRTLADLAKPNGIVVHLYLYECMANQITIGKKLPGADPADYVNHARVPKWATAIGARATVASMPQIGQALESALRGQVPSFRWYRNVTSRKWSGRVGGWEVCDLGDSKSAIRYGQTEKERKQNEPVTATGLEALVQWIRLFAKERADPGTHQGSTKNEHLLEAAILRGRVTVPVESQSGGTKTLLQPLFPLSDPPLQVPALFSGHPDAPVRFIDAIMKEGDAPWVLELKVDTEGQGQYYRHAITQSALYREFLKQALPLHPWFTAQGVDATKFRAAMGFPKLKGSRAHELMKQIQKTAECFGVEVVELNCLWPALQEKCMQ